MIKCNVFCLSKHFLAYCMIVFSLRSKSQWCRHAHHKSHKISLLSFFLLHYLRLFVIFVLVADIKYLDPSSHSITFSLLQFVLVFDMTYLHLFSPWITFSFLQFVLLYDMKYMDLLMLKSLKMIGVWFS